MQGNGGGIDGFDRKRFYSALGTATVLVIVIFAAYGFYGFNGDSFDLTDRQVLLIVTDSMDGDVTEYAIDSFPEDTFVMIHRLSDSKKMNLEVGDVISFEQTVGSQRILNHHRIIETHFTEDVSTSYVITKGDNPNITTTETVYLSEINGEVIGTNHAAGVVASFLKAYWYIVLGVIFAVLALFIIKWALQDPDDE